jgi:hypothetical protein
MKKIILASVVAVSALVSQAAFAGTICTRASAAHAGTIVAADYGTAGTNYMVTAIAPKCSANVELQGADSAGGTYYYVAANSSKGKNSFGSSTGGFNVTLPCPATGCTSTEVGTTLAASNFGT